MIYIIGLSHVGVSNVVVISHSSLLQLSLQIDITYAKVI